MSNLPYTKKSLGQHWLTDKASLLAICDAAAVGSEDTVLEIGPGPGSLTQELVMRAKQVVAVEFDNALAGELSSRVQANNLVVVQQDILQFDLTQMEPGYKVVANIPYYLTSNLIRVLSESVNPPLTTALLVQKEVAQRLAAPPGAMSLLSVTAQFYWQVSTGIEVPARLFTPPPKVDSQIVILRRRDQPLFSDVAPKQFFLVVKAGFSNRRKTLLNSLSAGLRIGKAEALLLLQDSDVRSQARPQELSLDEWYALYRVLCQKGMLT